MEDVPVLVCTEGALAGQAVRVPQGGLGIGRAEENGVVLPDDGVSRYHARLLYDNGSLWLRMSRLTTTGPSSPGSRT